MSPFYENLFDCIETGRYNIIDSILVTNGHRYQLDLKTGEVTYTSYYKSFSNKKGTMKKMSKAMLTRLKQKLIIKELSK